MLDMSAGIMKLVLKGKPVSINDLYAGRRYLTIEGKTTKADYYCQTLQQMGWKKPMEGKIRVVMTAYFTRDNADLDNCTKGCFDSLNRTVWVDDKQVVEIHAYKRIDKKDPRIEMEITELEDSYPQI